MSPSSVPLSTPGRRVSFREEHRTQTGQSDLSSGAVEKDFLPAGPANWEDTSVGARQSSLLPCGIGRRKGAAM